MMSSFIYVWHVFYSQINGLEPFRAWHIIAVLVRGLKVIALVILSSLFVQVLKPDRESEIHIKEEITHLPFQHSSINNIVIS